MLKICKCFFLFLLLFCINLSGQSITNDSALKQKISENVKLFSNNPEKAIRNVDNLLKEAILLKDHEAELILLSNKCWYQKTKLDLNQCLISTKYLEMKAKEYGNPYYEAVSHEYASEVFSYNNLAEKAIAEFKEAIVILDKVDPQDEKVAFARSNFYTVASNAYINLEKTNDAIKVLLLAEQEISNISDKEKKRTTAYLNYSNLAMVYVDINLDSAKYYIDKSEGLKTYKEEKSITQLTNYLVLGEIYRKKLDFINALANYKKAETISLELSSKPILKETLFKGLVETYSKIDKTQVEQYSNKLREVQLEIEQNKNKSLHKIIDESLLKEKNYILYISLISVLIILVILALLIRSHRINKRLMRQELVSQQYLEDVPPFYDEQSYSELIKMVKNNDPAFLSSFLEKFPKFSEKLLNINRKIVQTEIEFCAYLKLNLSTKEIARYRNIQQKTVQNKKNRIRKKLEIPEEIDIYFWFRQF